jgi:hypothetical protein
VSRCPSSSLYDAGHFLPDTALTLATVFGMLQVGASDRSIASELLIQRHLHKTYDGANSLWSADSESICSLFVGRAKATDPPVSQTSLLHSMLLSRVQSASVPRKPWPKRVSVAQLPSASAVPPVAKAVGLAAGVVLAYRLAKLFL